MNIQKIITEVQKLLGSNDGHGIDHVLRVRDMAVSFARQDGADVQIVEVASLLHDVDDYKLFGEEYAANLINTKSILEKYSASEEMESKVINIIKTMGYNKFLEGVRPATIEGMIVSDADMCDAIGAEGVLRTHAYALSKQNPFFDPTLLPMSAKLTAFDYRTPQKSHSVQHFFDKLLIIPSIMMSPAGKIEAQKRKKIMIDFLRELFREENNMQWSEHLEDFVKIRSTTSISQRF